ncbi:predicted protein [Sclerotinia sclerotiorum 1980 UF-70]|uniref:Uncharacterized protein n=1 Tax=Sclerotinia sclerotiorum (strain ATCC 18683 / 1980 / Ss-1) TaxID=665079 RepID=A7F016_SCLS1|nr:predicted protein [Sclerotinia sclerotiorum 1980 UF-70]EDN95058.1 predicted protein [Sclerotinia sclerotiorum 1980 UF-70]
MVDEYLFVPSQILSLAVTKDQARTGVVSKGLILACTTKPGCGVLCGIRYNFDMGEELLLAQRTYGNYYSKSNMSKVINQLSPDSPLATSRVRYGWESENNLIQAVAEIFESNRVYSSL